MADQTIFVTPDDMLWGGFIPPQMIEDLRCVAAIPAESIERLANALTAAHGFLGEEHLAEAVVEHIEDEEQASAAASTLRNLRPEALERSLNMLNAWRESAAAKRERFPDDVFASLQEKLPALVRDYPALARMRKANRLRTVLGNELEGVEFICDARPVFDAKRERVEGLLALTTMKLVYERQNGVTEEVEILLKSNELDELVSEAQKAQQKVRALEARFARWVDEEGDGDE